MYAYVIKNHELNLQVDGYVMIIQRVALCRTVARCEGLSLEICVLVMFRLKGKERAGGRKKPVRVLRIIKSCSPCHILIY
jgi:hypothetical protein